MSSYVTKEGLDKMKAELEQLEKVQRPQVTMQIAEARDKGDLSENAEYDAAKEAQGMLEMRISKLKNSIKIVCPKDGAEWILLTGEPINISQLPPKTYTYTIDNISNTLFIQN